MEKKDWLNYLRDKKIRILQAIIETELNLEHLEVELKETERWIEKAEKELKKEEL